MHAFPARHLVAVLLLCLASGCAGGAAAMPNTLAFSKGPLDEHTVTAGVQFGALPELMNDGPLGKRPERVVARLKAMGIKAVAASDRTVKITLHGVTAVARLELDHVLNLELPLTLKPELAKDRKALLSAIAPFNAQYRFGTVVLKAAPEGKPGSDAKPVAVLRHVQVVRSDAETAEIMDELVDGMASTLGHAQEEFAVAPKSSETASLLPTHGVAIIQVAPRLAGKRGNAVGYFSDMLRSEGFKPELDDDDDDMIGFATPEGYHLSIDVIRSNHRFVQVGGGIDSSVKTLVEAAEACNRMMLGHPFVKCGAKDDAGRLQVVLIGNGFVGAASDPRLNFRNLVAGIHAASRSYFKAAEELRKASGSAETIEM